MCGIAGFSGDFDAELLVRMSSAVAHRGPDDKGTWTDASHGIGLAHRRLSIIDLSTAGHQPMADASGKIVIVYNGELFNYRELRAELTEDGVAFRGHSDTEVLLNLYRRDGVDMLGRLNGMFAFALWDAGARSLFIARDGVGVKPLYYASTSRGVVFASELKSVIAAPEVSRALDPAAVHYHVAYLWCPAPHTMFRAVRKLEPGHALLVKEGRIVRDWQYYDLPTDGAQQSMTVDEAVAGLDRHLEAAVRRQLVADVPVGAFLSGGLDSSAIVSTAVRLTPDNKPECFTIAFANGGESHDDGSVDYPYAAKVASHLGVDLHTIRVGPDMVLDLPSMLYHLDEPQADLAPLHVFHISRLARSHGIKVLLSGAGGDDILAGYRRHYAVLQERYWSHLPAIARRALGVASERLGARSSWARRIGKAFRDAHLDRDLRMAGYFCWLDPGLQWSLYSSTLQQDIGRNSPFLPMLRTLARLPKSSTPLASMLYLEGKHFLADHNLNYTDKLSMAAGVEVRVPLLDPDLIKFAATVPDSFKQRGRIGKWLLRKQMEPYLPHDVIWRPKTGFGVPLRRWLNNELRPVVDDVLSEQSLASRGLFDPAGVERLLRLDRSGRLDASYTVLALVALELWMRIFVDGTEDQTARIWAGRYGAIAQA